MLRLGRHATDHPLPHIGGRLETKMDGVAETEAEIIASGCPGCQMQLSLGVKRRGLEARVVHPSQLLAEAYRNAKRTDAQ